MRIAWVSLLVLAGCVQPITSGIIVGKHYHEAYDEVEFDEITIGDDTIKIPHTVHHPERWEIVIADDQGRSRRLEVNQRGFEKAERGGYWTQRHGSVPKGVLEQ